MVAGPGHPCLGTVGYVPRRASKSALRSPLGHSIVDLLLVRAKRVDYFVFTFVLATPRTRPIRATPSLPALCV